MTNVTCERCNYCGPAYEVDADKCPACNRYLNDNLAPPLFVRLPKPKTIGRLICIEEQKFKRLVEAAHDVSESIVGIDSEELEKINRLSDSLAPFRKETR